MATVKKAKQLSVVGFVVVRMGIGKHFYVLFTLNFRLLAIPSVHQAFAGLAPRRLTAIRR